MYYFHLFIFSIVSFFELSFINMKQQYFSKGDNNYLPFQKSNKSIKNNFKIDINGISDLLETCEILFLHKSLFINQLGILSHVVLKALHKSYLNPFPNKPLFIRVCSSSLLKTLWEKEKLLVTSNFSFSHTIFSPLGKLSAIFVKYEIVVYKLCQFGRVWERVDASAESMDLAGQ